MKPSKFFFSASVEPTSSLTPYSFSTFFFSCLKHSSIRSWKGRKSSVTLFPWREIPPPSNGIYKHRKCSSVNEMASLKMTCKFVLCIQRKCVLVLKYLPGNEVFETQKFLSVLRVLLGVFLSEESLKIFFF